MKILLTRCFIMQKRKYIGCNNCRILGRRKNIETFKKEIEILGNNEYYIPEDQVYINNKTKIGIFHKKCNKLFYATPNHFITGSRCSYCMGKTKHNIDDLKNKVPEGYLLLSDTYINTDGKLTFFHKKCKNEFLMTHHDFFAGKHRCPMCAESTGEKIINEAFIDNNFLNFSRQKYFDDLKDKRVLKFDFYLNDFNLLIEYDGEQHYVPVKFSNKNNKNTFELTKKHDKLKNNYCRQKNIFLLRIPFWQKQNIKNIISKLLIFLYNNELTNETFSKFKKDLKLGRFSKNKYKKDTK